MVVFPPERNKPFKCKTILLFCPPDWELTEMGLYLLYGDENVQMHGQSETII